jgi:hypothetical protein
MVRPDDQVIPLFSLVVVGFLGETKISVLAGVWELGALPSIGCLLRNVSLGFGVGDGLLNIHVGVWV